jgi:hypothetical protein
MHRGLPYCSEEVPDSSIKYPFGWLLHLIGRHWSRLLQTPLLLGVLQVNYKYMNAYVMILKGKCALGPFLSILVIECQHKCLNVNLCPWMDKLQIKSKGMFLSLNTLVLCTNILV